MFNDVLSREECEGLVRRLATCAFPFQCAHGRPSIAPLLKPDNIFEAQGVGTDSLESMATCLASERTGWRFHGIDGSYEAWYPTWNNTAF